jgi:predicted anti-sigma-YlaC factor YlaD
VSFPATDCARARESVSAQLDGELPEHELDRLEIHLLICPACTAWAEEVRDLTWRLREAGVEEPVERVVLPRLRRGAWRVSSAVAVASAAAVVATMFVAPGQRTSLSSGQAGPQAAGVVSVTERPYVVSRLLRLEDGMFSPVSTSRDTFRHV